MSADDPAETFDGEARLKIWRAPAYDKARGGAPEIRVKSFLRQKGVPEKLARQAAAELVQQARREQRRLVLPRIVLGVVMILFGVGFSVASFLSEGAGWLVAIGPVALGIWLLFGRRHY